MQGPCPEMRSKQLPNAGQCIEVRSFRVCGEGGSHHEVQGMLLLVWGQGPLQGGRGGRSRGDPPLAVHERGVVHGAVGSQGIQLVLQALQASHMPQIDQALMRLL